MVASILTLALASTQQTTFAEIKAIDASLFKNGYAMVTYQIPVPASGVAWIKDPPQGTLGTLWLFAEQGGQISEVVMSRVDDVKTVTVTAQNLVEILTLNKGKTATLSLRNPNGQANDITAKIIDANAQIVIYEADGQRIVTGSGNVLAVKMADTVYTSSSTVKEEVPALRIRATGSKNVYMVALQNGLTWSPAYNVDITDENKLTLTARATIINDLVDLNVKETRFVSGFPNIQFLGQPDPLTFYLKAQDLAGRQAGGFGGGGAPAGAAIANQRAYRPEGAMEDFANSFAVNDLSGFQAEDLYFYQLPNVNLKKGDRGYYMIFQSQSDYKHVYTLDIPSGAQRNQQFAPTPPERTNAWHKLKFKNTTGRPLTTAPALIMQRGQMLAQDTLTYVPNGAEIRLPITQALDIASVLKEEETNIERGTIKDRHGNPIYDTITIAGTLELTNYKAKAVDMEITKDVIGEVVTSSHSGTSTKTARNENGANPNSTIRWTLTLQPGQKQTLTYTTTMFVQSRGL